MGCGNTKEVAPPPVRSQDETIHGRKSSSSLSSVRKSNGPTPRDPTPPQRDPTPPPKDPPPPPRDPTPPPKDPNSSQNDDETNIRRTYYLMGGPNDDMSQQKRDHTPDKIESSPVPTPPPVPPPNPPNDENENFVKENEDEQETRKMEGKDHEIRDECQNDQIDPHTKGEGHINADDQEEHRNEFQGEVEGQTNLVDPQKDENKAQVEEGHGDQEKRPSSHDLDNDLLIPHPTEHDRDHQDNHDTDKEGHKQDGQGTKNLQGYHKSDYGIFEKLLEFRADPEPLDQDFAQEPGSLPFVDEDFGPSVAIKGADVEWKRPREFRPDAVLFSSGATRFDIGQGSAGTCWFLSTVAMLADKPDLFHRNVFMKNLDCVVKGWRETQYGQVVPKDAWNPDGGYFFCFFWRYGEWERVVIDDYLPVIYGEHLWGAKSADDQNEMWPALLEKAFARFHGNYNSVYGGQSGDAYLALTGGCSEYIDFDKEFDKDKDGSKARFLHARLKNAVKSGSLVCTEVPAEYDKHQGLVGGHAYSLTGASQVVDNRGQPVYLVRVRNPWGHTEWTGKWQDNGPEWDTIPKGQLSHHRKDDGEFWIELNDFMKYFSGVTICSMTPDFDQDGCEDTINVCTTLFGGWSGETAAGFQNRLANPKYIFAIDDEGMDSDGLVPLVLQICQKLKHRQKNKASIRIDLYQVLAEQQDRGIYVLQLLGQETNVYKKERQMSTRYKVEPGQYVALPSTIDPGIEKDYLVRVFSPDGLIDVRQLDGRCNIMSSEKFESPDVPGIDNKIRFSECHIGSWSSGYNAGGQVSQEKFYLNPQVEFQIPDRGPQLVNITAMRSSRNSEYPIGCRLFDLDDDYQISRDGGHQSYLYSHYENCPQTFDGGQGAFVNGSSAEITHILEPGKRYFVIFHLDAQDTENDFAAVVRSTCALNLKVARAEFPSHRLHSHVNIIEKLFICEKGMKPAAMTISNTWIGIGIALDHTTPPFFKLHNF